MTKVPRWSKPLTLLAALTLVTAACGDDDDAETADTSGGDTTEAPVETTADTTESATTEAPVETTADTHRERHDRRVGCDDGRMSRRRLGPRGRSVRGQPARRPELAAGSRDGGRRDQRRGRHPRVPDRPRVPGHPSRSGRLEAGRRRHGRRQPVRLPRNRVLVEHDRQHGRGPARRDPDVRRRRGARDHQPRGERRQRLHLPDVVRSRHGVGQVHQLHRRPGRDVDRHDLQERRVRRRRSRRVRGGVR